MSEDKLYAIVIGERKVNMRYVTTCPFVRTDKVGGKVPLAVYLSYTRAMEARQLILKTCGHKSVHIACYVEQGARK